MRRSDLIALALCPVVTLTAAALGWVNWFVMNPVASDVALLPSYRWLYLPVVLAPVWPALFLMLYAARYGARRSIISERVRKWIQMSWFVLLLVNIMVLWLAWAVDFDRRIAESDLKIMFTGYTLVLVLAAIAARTIGNSRCGTRITSGWPGATGLGLLAAISFFVLATPFLTLGGLYGPPSWILVIPITIHLLLLTGTWRHWSRYLIPEAADTDREPKEERRPPYPVESSGGLGIAQATLVHFVLWLAILVPVFILLMALLLSGWNPGPVFILATAGLIALGLGWLLLLFGRGLYWLGALAAAFGDEQSDTGICSKPDTSLVPRPPTSRPDEEARTL